MRLEDQVAIVTGAASGIGRACAQLFAKEGAAVVVADIDAEKGREVVEAAGRSSSRPTWAMRARRSAWSIRRSRRSAGSTS
jgi:NAD(P)-dependent dehydrogenase (short-subunit alcohol dehydrogenase family)